MTIIIIISFISGEEAVFITVLNRNPLKANYNNPKFQCYQTSNDTSRTYDRYVDTRNGSLSNNPAPPAPTQHHQCDKAQIITISNGQDGFGIFYCRGTQADMITSTVPTILLRNDGK